MGNLKRYDNRPKGDPETNEGAGSKERFDHIAEIERFNAVPLYFMGEIPKE